MTYAALAAGLRMDTSQPQAFRLRAGWVQEHSITVGDQSVPVNGPYLKAVLEEAELELLPGQVILLEAELVRDLLEEALGRIAHDQALAEKERAELEAVLARTPVRLGSMENAMGDALAKREDVRRRKVALLSAGLALDELRDQKGCPKAA